MNGFTGLGITLGFALVLAGSSATAQAPDGAALYQQHCRSCHGAKGVPSSGMVTMFPGLKALADSAFLAARSEDSLVGVMQNGAGKMRSFKDKLTPEQMVAIARFIKTLPSAAGS
jgi:mono/diheme cytochrome c family protein